MKKSRQFSSTPDLTSPVEQRRLILVQIVRLEVISSLLRSLTKMSKAEVEQILDLLDACRGEMNEPQKTSILDGFYNDGRNGGDSHQFIGKRCND